MGTSRLFLRLAGLVDMLVGKARPLSTPLRIFLYNEDFLFTRTNEIPFLIHLLVSLFVLYPLERWLPTQNDLQLIEGKRFSHKRAVECQQVMIEFVLLEPTSDSYVTNYFNGRYQLTWPRNSLSSLLIDGQHMAVVCRQALYLHRQCYPHIAAAYQSYLHDSCC